MATTPTPIGLLPTTFPINLIQSVKSWQVGQIFHALVVGRNQNGLLDLKIGTEQVTSNTRRPFQPGESLKLLVIKNDDQVVLQVLDKQNRQTAKPLLQQLLRQALPRHTTPSILFKKLDTFNSPTLPKPTVLPKAVVKQITELMALIPDWKVVSNVKGLKQAIQNSGIFMEARLATILRGGPSATSSVALTPATSYMSA